jgi:hypothetical protein
MAQKTKVITEIPKPGSISFEHIVTKVCPMNGVMALHAVPEG